MVPRAGRPAYAPTVAELDYAVLAEFATLADDGALTLVGAHRASFRVARCPTEQVLGVGGRVFVARREPPAVLSLGASTPGGDVPVVARWPVDPRTAVAVEGRLAVCFAVTLLAPVPAAGPYTLTLSVNGEQVRRLPFAVVDEGAGSPG